MASTAPSTSTAVAEGENSTTSPTEGKPKDDEDDFSSKAQIMTLMTTDVDRVSDFSWHVFSLVGKLATFVVTLPNLMLRSAKDAPVEIVIGTLFLYRLLGKF